MHADIINRLLMNGHIDPALLLPGQSVTNNLPSSGFVWIHAPATNSGTATLTLSFKGTGIASNYTASASVKATT